MERAGELLRRARENRAAMPKANANAIRQTEAVQHPGEASGNASFAQGRQEAARSKFQPHHGAYTELMRSHDRLRTRHLPVQSGGGRA